MPVSPFQQPSAGSQNLHFSFPVARQALRPLVDWVFDTRGLEALWNRVQCPGTGECVFERLLQALDVRVECSPADLDRIPVSGPLVLVANHPHGLLDGLILGSLVARRRSDFRLLANAALTQIDGLAEYVIPVEVFAGDARRNGLAARAAIRWMRSGGAVAAFPAGEVSALNGMPPRVVDRDWSDGPAQLAQRAGAKIVHAYISGQNSLGFQLAGIAHPSLRTLLLGRELLNKRGRTVRVTVGHSIETGGADVDGGYLHRRTYVLRSRSQGNAKRQDLDTPRQERLAMPESPAVLLANVEALGPDHLLHCSKEYQVFIARAEELPAVLPEIGRLREKSFRAVGEGTGRSRDLDAFDKHYEHLFVWNRELREVVGAYRVGRVSSVTATQGLRGLYTNTLFRFGDDFVRSVSPGIELGRSFVREEYQRTPHSLFFLWRGIGAYIARHPEVRCLFSPVSISNDYEHGSRELMVQYFRQTHRNVAAVNARNPFRAPVNGIGCQMRDLAELSAAVSDLEADGKGLPVLLRQYLNLGARIVEFNVDRSFAGALDALIVVDLLQAPARALAKYMGQAQLAAWQAHHGLDQACESATNG